MTQPHTEDEDDLDHTTETAEEKPKVVIPKIPTPKFGASFPSQHNFRGGNGNNMNNRQRPGRAANRGR